MTSVEKQRLIEPITSVICASKTINLTLSCIQITLFIMALILTNINSQCRDGIIYKHIRDKKDLPYVMMMAITDWMLFTCYTLSTIVTYIITRLNIKSMKRDKIPPNKILYYFTLAFTLKSLLSQVYRLIPNSSSTNMLTLEPLLLINCAIFIIIAFSVGIIVSKYIIALIFLSIIAMTGIALKMMISSIYSTSSSSTLYDAIVGIEFIITTLSITTCTNICLLLTYIVLIYQILNSSRSISAESIASAAIQNTMLIWWLIISISNISNIDAFGGIL